MAWSFRKRIPITPGAALNLSSRGIGLSIGGKGLYYRQPLMRWDDMAQNNNHVEGVPPLPKRQRRSAIEFVLFLAVLVVLVIIADAVLAHDYHGARVEYQWNGGAVIKGRQTRTYIMPQPRWGTRLHCSKSGHQRLCSWW